MGNGQCIRCGNDLAPHASKYCSTQCGRKHTKHDARARREFVGLDGEGVDRPDGKHDYVLLTIGDQSLYHKDGRRLKTKEILRFVCTYGERRKDAIIVGFYLDYDFSQWFKDLPESKARELFTNEGIAERRIRARSHHRRKEIAENGLPIGSWRHPEPVMWEGFEFDLLASKRLRIRQKGTKAWIYVCDVGPFFQSSFLKAIDPEQWPEPVITDQEYEIIGIGKEKRSSYLVDYDTPIDPELIGYNALECDILARLMTRYDQGLKSIDIELKRQQWFGPGQAAQKWLDHRHPPVQSRFILKDTPQGAVEAARSSYFGGWFEVFQHGLVGDCWTYDINSAYPTIIAQLPCIRHASWRRGSTQGAFVLVSARVYGADPWIGAVPHRRADGSIVRPQCSEGWYWLSELQAGYRAGVVDSWDLMDSWEMIPCERHPPPMRELAELYNRRLEWGKKSPQGKAARLVYNSVYGKFAQSVGAPKYGNSIYASLITSGCRRMILDAISSHPSKTQNVVMVATDGVCFTSPHPSLPLTSTLGEWDETKHDNMSIFMPGIYWDDAVRNGYVGGVKSRGVNFKALLPAINEIDEQWSWFAGAWYGFSGWAPEQWPSHDLEIPFNVISPKLALHRNDWSLCGATSSNLPRHISSSPLEKRRIPGAFDDVEVSEERIHTLCLQQSETIESVPYDKLFGQLQYDDRLSKELVTRDGVYSNVFGELRE